MLRKIKKLFSLLPLVLLGLLFPNLSSAGVLADLGTFIVTRPFFGIAWVLAKIAIYLVGLAGSLLNWVLSPNFIRMSYTKPGPAIPNNPIIETGLGVTQGFVNMLLVLVLVYIAIATILRLAGYETKKLLVTFIIVALLVNFAPVICGLIVDASNIVMNFFVQDLKADAFGNEMGRKVSDISSGFEWLNVKAGEDWGRMFQLLIMAGFLFYLCLILGIFTLIFILRYLVIWLLVILSPLAFVCYILPATRKYFEQWWEQFLAWSFIGVTCGFFLYLGLLMVSLVPTAITAPTTGQGGAFDPILPYFVSVVFLGLGIFFGLQTSALGASTVINVSKQSQAGSAKWIGKRTARGVGRFVEEKTGLKEKVGKISTAVEKVPGLRWFYPEPLKKYGEFAPAINKAQTEAKDYSSKTNMDNVMTGESIGVRAAGKTLETIMRGDSEDIFDAGRRKFGTNFTDEQLLQNEGFRKKMKRVLQIAKQGGKSNDIVRRDPRLAALLAGETWAGDYANMTGEEAIKQATSEARSGHIANWEKQVIAKEHYGLPVTETLMERGREPFENIARNVKQGVETIQNSVDKLFSDYIDNVLEQTNSDLTAAVRSGDQQATQRAWGEYNKHFRTQHQNKEGFFVALQGQRFKDLGYRQGQYIKPGTPPHGPIPGTAAMGGPPPSAPPPPGVPKTSPKQPPGAPKRTPKPPPGAPKRP